MTLAARSIYPSYEAHSADGSKFLFEIRPAEWVVVFDSGRFVRRTREDARRLIRSLKDPDVLTAALVLES